VEKNNNHIYRKQLVLEQMMIEIFDAVCKKRRCPVCGDEIRVYIPARYRIDDFLTDPLSCPACESEPRHRLLALLLGKHGVYPHPRRTEGRPFRLLHFAPEMGFLKAFGKHSGLDGFEYHPADLDAERFQKHGISVRKEDIQRLSFEDSYFDLVICSHVLEHVADDRMAIGEIRRVLKPNGGTAYLMVPKASNQPLWKVPKLGRTLEAPYVATDEQRELLYGQHDHMRLYSDDFIDRLEGFDVEIVAPADFLDEAQMDYYRIGESAGEIYVCRKA
jgi:SAM-dependent methyltransferase